MSAGEASPPVMKNVVVFLGANFERDKLVRRRAWCRFAASDQIRSWPPHSILNHIGDKQRKDHAYEPAQNRDVRFMRAGADEDGPEDQDTEGYSARVDEEPCYNICC